MLSMVDSLDQARKQTYGEWRSHIALASSHNHDLINNILYRSADWHNFLPWPRNFEVAALLYWTIVLAWVYSKYRIGRTMIDPISRYAVIQVGYFSREFSITFLGIFTYQSANTSCKWIAIVLPLATVDVLLNAGSLELKVSPGRHNLIETIAWYSP